MIVRNEKEKNQTLYQQYADVFEMIRYGRFGSTKRDYLGGPSGTGMFSTKGIIMAKFD